MDTIVLQSKLYALQKNINKPLNLEDKELKKWLGLILYFSISKLPNTRMHWAKNLSPLTDYEAEVMSRDLFEIIKYCLHLADNTEAALPGTANYDPIYKVRPLITHLRKKFQDIPKYQNLCIDEQMVPYKGKTKLKQYIPNKPKKFGYKLFILAQVKVSCTILFHIKAKLFQLMMQVFQILEQARISYCTSYKIYHLTKIISCFLIILPLLQYLANPLICPKIQ